jgi:eukaryotic translation initiation factor 2C
MGLSLNVGESSTVFYLCLSIPRKKLRVFDFLLILFVLADLSSSAFIEPLPVIDIVAQILGKDVYSKPISDADRVKV